MKKAIILANGAFPIRENIIDMLKQAKYLICCDGAINKLDKIGIKPFAIIGDLDSVSNNIKQKYADIIYHYSEQNTNDLTKSVNWCIEHKFTEIDILGATGEREDHAIGNIFLMMRYVKKIKVKMITDYGVFTPITQNTNFKSYKGQQVSIFSPCNSTKIVSTHNLRYSIQNQMLPELWNGTLNESIGDTFSINIKGEGLIVYQLN